jgi:hypothetical protein
MNASRHFDIDRWSGGSKEPLALPEGKIHDVKAQIVIEEINHRPIAMFWSAIGFLAAIPFLIILWLFLMG